MTTHEDDVKFFMGSCGVFYNDLDTKRENYNLLDHLNFFTPAPSEGGSEESSDIIDNEYAEYLFQVCKTGDEVFSSLSSIKEDNSFVTSLLPPSPILGCKRKREYETRSRSKKKDPLFWKDLYENHSVQEVQNQGTRISIVFNRKDGGLISDGVGRKRFDEESNDIMVACNN